MSRGSGGLAILIPAAGAAARMRGRDKLLETVRGQPLLADRVAAASTAPQAPGPVLVTLPSRERAPGRWDALEGSGAHLIEVATPGDGLSASLAAGIAAAVPGGHLGDISAAIGAVAIDSGYTVNTQFGGHGLGRTMHEDPHIPNLGERGKGLPLKAGMTLAIEPWWARGTNRLVVDLDGWTLRSADGSMTAHTEHTIAITADGPRILTEPN